MQQNIVATIVIACILILILAIYFLSVRAFSKDVIIFLLAVLQVISIFFILYQNTEGFFFEVSPQRKKCLEEQVSLTPINRSCHCCQKGTVGGYPPLYKDWLAAEGKNELWKRTDNYTTNPLNRTYNTQVVPTELV